MTPDDVEYAETHLPTVVVSSIGLLAIRAAVGFFVFTLVFTLRRSSEPALIYGLAAAAYGIGAFLGHTRGDGAARWFSEEQLIGLSLALPAAFTAVGILGASVPLLIVTSGMVGLSTTLGRTRSTACSSVVRPKHCSAGPVPATRPASSWHGCSVGCWPRRSRSRRGQHDGAHGDLRAGARHLRPRRS